MINVTKNNEGHWMNFRSLSGNQACIHIESTLLHGKRGIIEKAIIETCQEDCAADYSESAKTSHNTGQPANAQICSDNICDYCTHDWSQGNCGRGCIGYVDFEGRKLRLA